MKEKVDKMQVSFLDIKKKEIRPANCQIVAGFFV